MSVDYDAYYGIGYKVEEGDKIDEELLADGLEEYLCEEVGNGFECFQIGNAFTGEFSAVCLVIKDPFRNGLDLSSAKENLETEMKRLNIKPVGSFGLVGGLYVS